MWYKKKLFLIKLLLPGLPGLNFRDSQQLLDALLSASRLLSFRHNKAEQEALIKALPVWLDQRIKRVRGGLAFISHAALLSGGQPDLIQWSSLLKCEKLLLSATIHQQTQKCAWVANKFTITLYYKPKNPLQTLFNPWPDNFKSQHNSLRGLIVLLWGVFDWQTPPFCQWSVHYVTVVQLHSSPPQTDLIKVCRGVYWWGGECVVVTHLAMFPTSSSESAEVAPADSL